METTKVRINRYTHEDEAYWYHHIEGLAQSGMKIKDYCQAHDVNTDRFGYWRKKLHTDPALTDSLAKASSSQNPRSLLPVRLKTIAGAQRHDNLCTLTLKNGSPLHIHEPQALLLILERLA